MAWNVTTEWDDIHRKIGNYEPLPEIKPQNEHTIENIQKLEDLAQEEIKPEENLDEDIDLDDDKLFEEYRRKKLEELGGKSALHSTEEKSKNKFSGVLEITAEDYVREVNEAGADIPVLLNFYQNSVELTVKINDVFQHLANEFPEVKFIKTISTKCVQNFKDSDLPYILYYRNGQLSKVFSKKEIYAYRKINFDTLEDLFFQAGIQEFGKNKKNKKSALEFYNKALGRKPVHKEDHSSDEDEHEDRQFISNKMFIRY